MPKQLGDPAATWHKGRRLIYGYDRLKFVDFPTLLRYAVTALLLYFAGQTVSWWALGLFVFIVAHVECQVTNLKRARWGVYMLHLFLIDAENRGVMLDSPPKLTELRAEVEDLTERVAALEDRPQPSTPMPFGSKGH